MRRAIARPGYHLRSGVYRPLVAVLLYFLGMVVLPSVHLGFHRNDHDHKAGGLHFHSSLVHQHSASVSDPGHLHDAAGEATELAATLTKQRQNQRLLALATKTHGARSAGSFAPAVPSPPSPSAPDHGSGSLAHFSCSYLSGQDVLPRLPIVQHVGPALRHFASQHVPSYPFFGCLKARAPPVNQAS